MTMPAALIFSAVRIFAYPQQLSLISVVVKQHIITQSKNHALNAKDLSRPSKIVMNGSKLASSFESF